MTPEARAAAHSRAERHLTDTLTPHLPEDTAVEVAAGFLRWLSKEGWRPFPALADRPGPVRAASPAVASAALAEARAEVDRKIRARQEREAAEARQAAGR